MPNLIRHAALLYYQLDVSLHVAMRTAKEMTWLDKCVVEICLCLQLTWRGSTASTCLCMATILHAHRIAMQVRQCFY